MIEYLESRTLNAVDPSSVTWPGYVELAITKAGRLIVHQGKGSATVEIRVGSAEQIIYDMMYSPFDTHPHATTEFSILMYAESTGRFEQLSFAAFSDIPMVTAAGGAFGEMVGDTHYISVHDESGLNLLIRSRFVRSFHFDLGNGDDDLRLLDDFGRKSVILGGAGNDTLMSARAGDTIAGGDGDDTIASKADNQMLIGGRGNDVFITRSTSQTIFAGAGRDSATQVGYAVEDGLEDFVAVESLR